MQLLSSKPKPIAVVEPPAYFPPEFREYWDEIHDPKAIRREMATLLLADLRLTGPDWPTERFECLNRVLGGVA